MLQVSFVTADLKGHDMENRIFSALLCLMYYVDKFPQNAKQNSLTSPLRTFIKTKLHKQVFQNHIYVISNYTLGPNFQ